MILQAHILFFPCWASFYCFWWNVYWNALVPKAYFNRDLNHKPEAYLKPYEKVTRHSQKPSIRCYSAISRHIQNLVQCLHSQKPSIIKILEYSEPFHIYIPTHSESCQIYKNLQIFRTLTYTTQDGYSKPSQRFTIEFYVKIVKNCNYFSKALHLRSLGRFWIQVPLNKYSLICRDLMFCIVWYIFRPLSIIE